MKKLKLLFIPLVMVSFFSLVSATNCTDLGGGIYDCTAGQYCAGASCECNGGMISSGSTCGTACTFDGLMYTCNAGDYCSSTNPMQCECDGSMIATGLVCNPAPPPPTSCSYLGTTIYSGQTMTVYQTATVPSTGTCGGLILTCNIVAGVGTLTPSYVGYSFTGCIVLPPPTGSCTLPRGGSIGSGSSTTAYQTSSVACGSTCTSQVRSCNAGILSGTYTNGSCSVNSCGGGGGGGGGGGYTSTCIITDLVCTNGTYQKKPAVSCVGGSLGLACGSTGSQHGTGTLPIGSIIGSSYSTELNNAYLWAYAYGITTMNTIQKTDMTSTLLRSHMAKMISNFAITLGELTPNTGKQCIFYDIANQSAELRFYIKISCQLGLMGIGVTNFDPSGEVTRAQFGTILSRLIWGSTYDGGAKYYTNHLNALKLAGIMTNISSPAMKELRGYVMLMMKRTYEGGFMNN